MTETISSNKMELQLRFVLKNKDFKSKVRRINLKTCVCISGNQKSFSNSRSNVKTNGTESAKWMYH